MSIDVNGKRYTTLDDDFTVGGKKVKLAILQYSAINRILVYPVDKFPYVLRLKGEIDLKWSHECPAYQPHRHGGINGTGGDYERQTNDNAIRGRLSISVENGTAFQYARNVILAASTYREVNYGGGNHWLGCVPFDDAAIGLRGRNSSYASPFSGKSRVRYAVKCINDTPLHDTTRYSVLASSSEKYTDESRAMMADIMSKTHTGEIETVAASLAQLNITGTSEQGALVQTVNMLDTEWAYNWTQAGVQLTASGIPALESRVSIPGVSEFEVPGYTSQTWGFVPITEIEYANYEIGSMDMRENAPDDVRFPDYDWVNALV